MFTKNYFVNFVNYLNRDTKQSKPFIEVLSDSYDLNIFNMDLYLMHINSLVLTFGVRY